MKANFVTCHRLCQSLPATWFLFN